ncbi:hypothetical protein QTP88_006076 [Uroleucon formosanum]
MLKPILSIPTSKAFDHVNHAILIKKLRLFGFSGFLLKWFQSFLSGRLQIVKHLKFTSTQFTVPSGVPQESGVSNKDLCQELGISQSTLSTIWKSKDQIKSVFQKDVTFNKRLKCSQHQDVDQAILE